MTYRLLYTLLLGACALFACDASTAETTVVSPPVSSLEPKATSAAPAKPETPSTAATAAEDAPKPATPAATGPTKKSLDAMCDGICKRSEELHCDKANECRSICAESMTYAVCEQELVAATQCVIEHPAADWKCIERGLAQIKEPFCDAEQRAFGKCLMAHAPKP